MGDELVRAAGGVVWRQVDGADEVLLVHRDKYDDWTLPKGKLDPGESWEQAAVREVFEETGVVAVLGPELADAEYVDNKGRPKRVRYWAMAVAAEEPWQPDAEISQKVWLRVDEAELQLTYAHDVEVLASFRDRRHRRAG